MNKLLNWLSLALVPICVGPLWQPALPVLRDMDPAEDLETEEDIEEIVLLDQNIEKMVRHYNERWIQEELYYIQNPEAKKAREKMLNDKILESYGDAKQISERFKSHDRVKEATVIDHNDESVPDLKMGGAGGAASRTRGKVSTTEEEIRQQHLLDLCGARIDGEHVDKFTEVLEKDATRLKSLEDVQD